jgi:hypothetical protein
MLNRRILLGGLATSALERDFPSGSFWRPLTNALSKYEGHTYRLAAPRGAPVAPVSVRGGTIRFTTTPTMKFPEARAGRAELVDDYSPERLENGIDYWAGFDFKLTVSPRIISPLTRGGWLLCGQLHTRLPPDSLSPSPVFAFYFGDPAGTNPDAPNGLGIYTRSSVENPVRDNPPPNT